jgi:glutaredoxin 3
LPAVTVYTRSWCPYCQAALELLTRKGVAFEEIEITGKSDLREAMAARAQGATSVPQIFIGERHVGGCDELYALDGNGELDQLLAA